MINVLERYSGRTIKDGVFEAIQDELQELDETFLYEIHLSAYVSAMVYIEKESRAIRLVRCKKGTSSGSYRIMTAIADNNVKSLDRRINSICEESL